MAQVTKKSLLIVNDDGIEAPGLKALVRTLLKDERFVVRVVAPATEQSAKSGAMTVHGTLECQKHEFAEPGESSFLVLLPALTSPPH